MSVRGVLLMAVAGVLLSGPALAGVRLETQPKALAPGQVFEVTVKVDGKPLERYPTLRFSGRSFPLWPAGRETWEGLAALDRDASPGVKEVVVVSPGPGGETMLGREKLSVGERDYGVQRIHVDERMVTLSPKDEARAERENRQIRSVLARVTPVRLWRGSFGYPVPGPITGPFGVRRVFNGKPRNYHTGVDIAASRGTPVLASAAGRVALVGDYFYTGNTVILDHGDGLYTAYFHMESVAVAVGEAVDAGSKLGKVGSTGRSTGPHLHWSVYLSGLRVDPVSLVTVTERVPVGG